MRHEFLILVGKRGSGKSYLATQMAVDALRAGLKVWANYDLDFRHIAGLGGDWRGRVFRADDISDVAWMRDGIFIFDESHWKLNARTWKDLDTRTHEYLAQSRKIHMGVVLISQSMKRLDPIPCEIADRAFQLHRFGRLHWYKTFDSETLKRTESAAPKSDGLPSFFWRRKEIMESYDTDALFGSLLRELPPRSFRANGQCDLRSSPPPIKETQGETA